MNLLLFNLVTDVSDPILGFTSRWIDALARRVEHVDVVTMRSGVVRTLPNVAVHSVGKERGLTEVRRAVEFYRALRGILAARPIDACFSHMMPLFSVMGAPLLRRRRIPIVTWYTHRQMSAVVRMAYAVSARVVTASPESWPYLRDKLEVVGHGIDTEVFCPTGEAPARPPLVVSVGRVAPIKNTHLMVEAAQVLRRRGVEARWAFVGATVDRDRRYAEGVRARIAGWDGARLVGAVNHEEVARWHQAATVHVSLSPPGLFDKAVLEAMACGRPGIVAHPGYDDVLGDLAPLLTVPALTPEAIADRVAAVIGLEPAERQAIGVRLREAVASRHGLDALADRLVALLHGLAVRDARLAA